MENPVTEEAKEALADESIRTHLAEALIENGLHPSRVKILIDMLKTLSKKRSIDIIVTTHNPALLDAAGNTMVPFITIVHRDDKNGSSLLTQLEDIEQLPKLMAGGSLGRLTTEGRIEKALKTEAAR